MRSLLSIIASAGICIITSCAGYSAFPIENLGKGKINDEFCGIWKAVEDTDKMNFILVQEEKDLHITLAEVRKKYGSVSLPSIIIAPMDMRGMSNGIQLPPGPARRMVSIRSFLVE